MGLAFRGHDESIDSRNRGNFLELLKFLVDNNDDIDKVVLEKAPKNLQMVSPDIQKDMVHACSKLTLKAILEEIGNDSFGVLIDESHDISVKEQMVVCLRYVNNKGQVVERFLGIIHVSNTTALTLMVALEFILLDKGLSISRIRGQDYDGASNMQGEFNGLKTLIMNEKSSAFSIHCFAHQLQLTLVAVASKQGDVASFFSLVLRLLNVIGASCKRYDILRAKRYDQVREGICSGAIQSGRGLNQETSLQRPADTRWSSHYKTLTNLLTMFSSLIDTLEYIDDEGIESDHRSETCIIDQDIVNAMDLVHTTRQLLQELRDDGWEPLLDKVSLFCDAKEIVVPNMNDQFLSDGKSKCKAKNISNLHHYRVEIFFTTIDFLLQGLNNRFNEGTADILLCMACLSPFNSFQGFNKEKLLKLAQMYKYDFSKSDIRTLESQLDHYIIDMRSKKEFCELKGISDLSLKLAETIKHNVYPLVFKLLKLTLILPVATASVERAFSSMNYVKNKLRNRMSDQWLNDCLVTFIEDEMLASVEKEDILPYFQKMKPRRGQLSVKENVNS